MKRTTIALLTLGFAAIAPGCADVVVDPKPEEAGTGGESPVGDGDGDSGAMSGGSTYVVTTGGTMGLGGAASGGASSGGAASGGGGPVELPNCEEDIDCDDEDPCTQDVCDVGFCDNSDNGTCECKPSTQAIDCNDDNECTDDTCVNNQCENPANVATCTDDGNPCTTDMCAEEACGHQDSGLCTENTVVIRSMRDGNPGQWVSLNGTSQLVWNLATTLGAAELFNRVDEGAGTYKLQSISNDLYVVLGASDDLEATGSADTAAIFESVACGSGIGLSATNDDDAATVGAAEGAGVVKMRSTGCNADNAAAWERFEFITPGE